MFRNKTHGFTLIELLTVISVIIILAGLILSVSGYVQKKGATARSESEIAAISAACESYRADNGIYPRSLETDALDPRTNGDPTTATYQAASLYLYKALSGDTNANGKLDSGETKPYFEFKPNMLNGTKDATGNITAVTSIADPFGYSYGYSTANQADVTASPPVNPARGYNPTFDLWSTAGTIQTSATPSDAKWIKNW